MSDLPAHLHQDRLSGCFRTVGVAGLPEVLTSEPRFVTRLAELISSRYDLSENVHEGVPEDRLLLEMSREGLERLAVRAGIVLHARRFLREIRGPVLAAFAERFGVDVIEDARRHSDLAADRETTEDLDAFAATTVLEGQACLAAWINALPAPLQRRIQLKWPHDRAVPTTDDASLLDLGPAILRRLVAIESQAA